MFENDIYRFQIIVFFPCMETLLEIMLSSQTKPVLTNQIKRCSLGFLKEKLIFTKGADPGILTLWLVTQYTRRLYCYE